ncbi:MULTISPECIES: hypothetical protein [Streptomyces]|uniref:Uncharacterized protein n=1 Tax=Streptomyces mordarskii TaxID=1226758 RepID=A0ABN1DXW3_9ACTN
MQTSRPVTTLRPRPAAPEPQWRGLFLEPIYADGLPYETAAGADEFDDAEDDPAAA